jgi:hypothetical protein
MMDGSDLFGLSLWILVVGFGLVHIVLFFSFLFLTRVINYLDLEGEIEQETCSGRCRHRPSPRLDRKTVWV